MTTMQSNAVIFKDEAGAYFLLSEEALERARVPAEYHDEAARLFASSELDDTNGHAFMVGVLVGVAVGGGIMTAAWKRNTYLYPVIQSYIN